MKTPEGVFRCPVDRRHDTQLHTVGKPTTFFCRGCQKLYALEPGTSRPSALDEKKQDRPSPVAMD